MTGETRRWPPARWVIAAALCALAPAARAGPGAETADLEGLRVHPLVARPAGAIAYDFTSREREIAAFALDGGRIVHSEGRYTFVRYRLPPGTGCAEILGAREGVLRDAKLDIYRGTSLPDEAATTLGVRSAEGWVTGVGTEAGARTIHVLAACTAGGLAPQEHVVAVESTPPTMRGRVASRPAFDTAPPSIARAEDPQEERPEIVLECSRVVKAQVGPIAPVEVEGSAATVGSTSPAWAARFIPAAVTRSFRLVDSAVAALDRQLVCNYRGPGDLTEQAIMLTRPVPPGRTCVRGAAPGAFRCVKR